MKRSLRTCLLLACAALLLTVSALADTGPKPQLTIHVKNAPEGLYYLDLLEEDSEPPGQSFDHNLEQGQKESLDSGLVQTLRNAVPDGWHACLADGTRGGPMWGNLIGTNGLHTFGYLGVPDTYRVIIVTKSGKKWISSPVTRHTLQCSATVDWANQTISAPPSWIAYALQFLATCIPTLLIEGLLLAPFGFRWESNWKPFLLINLATQTGLFLTLGITLIRYGPNFGYYLYFLPAELVILITETLLDRKSLTGRSKRTAVDYGIAANFCSAAAGWFLSAPVWEWIASIS